MRTERRFNRPEDPYPWEYRLVFENIDATAPLDKPVEGTVFVTIHGEPNYPVELRLEDEPVRGNADYVTSTVDSISVQGADDYPQPLHIKVGPGQGRGAKFISMATADYDSDADIDSKEDPEVTKHHLSIPPAETVRLTHKLGGGKRTNQALNELHDYYDGDGHRAVERFAEELKSLVGFETRVDILNYLMQEQPISRDSAAAVNSVAKQLTKPAYQNRIQSPADLHRFIEIVDTRPHFGNINLEAVLEEVRNRTTPKEREAICDRLGVADLGQLAET